MKLSELYVDNFKAASGVRLELSHMTALVGVNGSGKSTILEALDHFFRGTPFSSDDYRDKEKPITISVKFSQVPRVRGSVTIKKTWVRGEDEPSIDSEPKSLKVSDPDKILDSVHMVFERAEHETDNDGTDQSDLDLVHLIKSTINEEISNADLATLFEQTNNYYQNLGNNIVKFTELMNQKLQGDAMAPTGYAPGSTVDFKIKSPDPEPDIETTFVEHGIELPHKMAGHGTKRAYHMAALEAYAEMSPKRGRGHLVLMLVDEPELHQHPQRLRRILQTYQKMSIKPSFQIVYSTHSPGLVDLEASGGIYRISRGPDLNIVANSGSGIDEEISRRSMSKKLAEGIFSTGVIIVEGWRDEALLEAIFSTVDVEGKSAMKRLIEDNIHMIHADGVSHVPDYVRFFHELGVPLFVVWDADKRDSEHTQNRAILDALGSKSQFVAAPDSASYTLEPNYLCFANDTGMYFREHLGFEGSPDTDEQKAIVKNMIRDTPDLTKHFKTPKFLESDFAKSTVPHILGSFPVFPA
ncbi:MAG: AAA family ATPase [Thaumarchaeota archaeon]|nr:AAA family ATPase [Nitrososphaerota archaeon]